ncbi:NADP-dependent oxidoreductase [Nocardioides oleivorans]|uniref:NADP-dependent oxidoreductase n=1 Tax=Nocardioides oleivorans TaxID=273676 RepID=A0A4Q2S2X6_9ACTN|nr:NADP-dependent oxidoreductase [Nocardioides oleivorans]RYB94463.1 NADP-dependent oxidoreductase [Nocardioides oleivorans]
MKAIRFHQYGDAGVLRLEDVESVHPGPGQVRVRVAGTSFNGVDANIRAGNVQGPMPLTLPHTPGLDVAGTVDALGEDVTTLAVGDRVVGFLPFTVDGAAAEQVVVDADALTAAPTSIPLSDSAALPLVGLTAWQAVHEQGGLEAGQRILVNGASGAVGRYAVQLAAAASAHVIATGDADARDHLLALGAEQVVDHTRGDVPAQVGEPVDVVLNLAPVTPEELAALAALVKDGGVVVNTTVWMPAPVDEVRGVRGVDLYVRSDAQQLAGLVARVDRGELVVDVEERVALADLASVHARAAAGTLRGKVVLVP